MLASGVPVTVAMKGHGKRMRNKKKILIACIAVAVLATSVTLVLVWLHRWPTNHFSVVQEGILYRGGQPTGKALEYMIERYKVRTVVNLRGPYRDQKWWQVERDICDKYGVRMIDLHIGTPGTAISGLKQFLVIAMDPSNGPVYVHCEYGSARTGYAIAAYRIVVQGWNYDQATKEARKFRFDPQVKLNREYDRILRELAAGADWRHLDSGVVASLPATAGAAPNE